MIDFNDAAPPSTPASESQREAIRAALLGRLESVLLTLFPAGKVRRGKFLIGDILGSPGDSLEIVLQGEKAGLWTDRATGDGGDIFDLIAAHGGMDVHADFPRVLDAAADLLGRTPPTPTRKTRKEAPVDDLQNLNFLDGKFQKGETFGITTKVHPGDAEANLRMIREAKRRADGDDQLAAPQLLGVAQPGERSLDRLFEIGRAHV